ncbi:MAG TPA: SRPBCC family protein [Candidatus Nanopelagicales bacterium]
MTTKVEKRILVNVPVSTAYNQWTQFEEFPHFMGGVERVTQLGDDRLEWVAQIAGVRRTWEARILEQVPDRKVAWAATSGATNAGAVTFEDLGGGQTSISLTLEYEPEGLVEQVGDKLHIVEKQAEADLERFKAFIEDEGYATGAWRGSINAGANLRTPTAADAAGSQGDSGKAGLSGVAKAAAAGAAAAGVAAAAAMASKHGEDEQPDRPVTPEVSIGSAEVSTMPSAGVDGTAQDSGMYPASAASDVDTSISPLHAAGLAGVAQPADAVLGDEVVDVRDPATSGEDLPAVSVDDEGLHRTI